VAVSQQRYKERWNHKTRFLVRIFGGHAIPVLAWNLMLVF